MEQCSNEPTFISFRQGVVVDQDQLEPGQRGEGGQGVPEHQLVLPDPLLPIRTFEISWTNHSPLETSWTIQSLKETSWTNYSSLDVLDQSQPIRDILDQSKSIRDILDQSQPIKDILVQSQHIKDILDPSQPLLRYPGPTTAQ